MNIMNNFRFLTIAAMGIASACVWAQSAGSDDDNVIYSIVGLELVGTNNSLGDIIQKDRPVEPDAVPKPKFAIRSKDNKFIFTVGGKINPIIGYDLGNDLYNAPDGGIDFVTGAIPVPPRPGHKSAFIMNPLGSFVDFTIVGLGGTPDQITAYVKLGTNSSTKAVQMKRAYVSWKGITTGLTQTTFQDGLAVQPPTIDPQGPCGDVANSTYSLSYKSKSYGGFAFGIGAELHSFYSSNGVYRGEDYGHEYGGVTVTGSVSTKAPDMPAYVEYAASDQNRVRLSGLLRNFFYRDLIANRTRYTPGWGAQLSGNFSFYKPLTFNFQAVYGRGIGCYIQDISGRKISYTPSAAHPGKMDANPMMGLVLGASFDATAKLQFNAVGSCTRVWDVENYAIVGSTPDAAGADNYKGAVYATANCFYSISAYFQAGIEYTYGRRYTWDMGSAADNRILAQLKFTF